MQEGVNSVLNFLRHRPEYKHLVTSRVAREILRLLPAKISFRLLKRLGPVPVKVRVGRFRFWVVTSSEDDHYLEVLLRGLRGWEVDSLRVWSQLCARGGTVIDVGAYAGIYSVLALASGEEKVIAYEPNPQMFCRLQATIAKNGYEDRTILRNIALSDNHGSERLMILDGRSRSSGAHLASSPSALKYQWVEGPLVETRELDAEITDLGIDAVSAIKVDSEGSESRILQGGKTVIGRFKPDLILEMLDEASLRGAIRFLRESYGGSPKSLTVRNWTRQGSQETFAPGNFLFKPRLGPSDA